LTLLRGTLAAGELGDIDDPELFVKRAINDKLRATGAHLRGGDYEELFGYLLLVLVDLFKRKYDPTRSSLKFSQYANPILHNRVTDWYRKRLGDSRYGPLPDEISWDDVDEHEQPAEPARVTLAQLLVDVNVGTLTPDARQTIEHIVKPIVARGATLDEIAEERGWNRRRVSQLITDLRVQLEAQNGHVA
jgi:RNA polymerase sigma factor (sigma-70 family)